MSAEESNTEDIENVVNVEQLPSTQYLVLETLAARIRLGERAWTFRTREKAAIETLAQKGLVTYKSGVIYQTLLVWLTEAGKKAMFASDNDYVAPLQRQFDELREQVAQHDRSVEASSEAVASALSQGEIVRRLRLVQAARRASAQGAPKDISEALEAEANSLNNAAEIAAGDTFMLEMYAHGWKISEQR